MMVRNKLKQTMNHVPLIGEYLRFRRTLLNKVPLHAWLKYKLGINRAIYWPVHKNSEVVGAENIYVGRNATLGIRPGCYINGNGGIFLGDFVRVASNVGIISSNHDVYNHIKHIDKPIVIREHSWIGQGALILAGCELGPRTIVAGGSVVTRSFPEGYCIIGGNPAHLIKTLEKEKFVPMVCEELFHGYIPEEKFSNYQKSHLSDRVKLLINNVLNGGD